MTQPTESTLRHRLTAYCMRLADVLQEPTVILCGSTALGENMPWSDIDVIVIADFREPFLERLKRLALVNETGLQLEVVGYTPDEFVQMLDQLNVGAIEAMGSGIPILVGRFLPQLKEKFGEMKNRGLTKTTCTYVLTGQHTGTA